MQLHDSAPVYPMAIAFLFFLWFLIASVLYAVSADDIDNSDGWLCLCGMWPVVAAVGALGLLVALVALPLWGIRAAARALRRIRG